MYEPTRGGTRGGQAEFKWTDVSADKDREHYLGHSINAPTGRWQKNKDVHWYNRDKAQSDDAKAQELAKIKEAEREAMSVALGFKASKPVGDGTTSGANAIPVGGSSAGPSIHHSPGHKASHDEEDNNTPGGSDGGDKKLTKEEKRARKAEKKLAKEERRREKQEERERRAMELVATQRQRSASPPPRRGGDHSHSHTQTQRRRPHDRDTRDERKRRRSRSLTPLKDLPWMPPPPPKRNDDDDDVSSSSPPLHREERSRSSTSGRRHQRGESGGVERTRRDYDGRAMERERANDRRRWEDNRARQESARGDWDRA